VCGPGYGNAPPLTVGGRAFCVLFGLFGLPLFVVAAYGIGDQLFDGIDVLRIRIRQRLLRRKALPQRSVICHNIVIMQLVTTIHSILSLIKQIDKTQPYNDNKKLK